MFLVIHRLFKYTELQMPSEPNTGQLGIFVNYQPHENDEKSLSIE
jgi:hypothetical protein